MNTRTQLAIFTSCILALSGCSLLNPKTEVSVEEKKENIEEIDTSDWKIFTNDEYGFSFRYPENLLKEIGATNGSNAIVFFHIESREEWEGTFGKKMNNLCDEELGDPDCGTLFNWPARYAQYQQALLGKEAYRFGYESLPVKQKVIEINNLRFVVGVHLGINGGCTLHYVTYQNNEELQFSTDICQDKFFTIHQIDGLSDGSYLNNQELMCWADDVLSSTPLDPSTKNKKDIIEQIIKTIQYRG